MATDNRRVAAYLPPEIDDRFRAFKVERGLATEEKPNVNDSQALVLILSEFFGVSREVSYSSAHLASMVSLEQFQELVSRVDSLQQEKRDIDSYSELMSKLLDKINDLEKRLEGLEEQVNEGFSLSTVELAKRLNMSSSTLSHWKSSDPKRGKSLDELLSATREKDPDGIGWILDKGKNRFTPERELPDSSKSVLQGDLLSAMPSDQVNPLPEGSERSGEG